MSERTKRRLNSWFTIDEMASTDSSGCPRSAAAGATTDSIVSQLPPTTVQTTKVDEHKGGRNPVPGYPIRQTNPMNVAYANSETYNDGYPAATTAAPSRPVVGGCSSIVTSAPAATVTAAQGTQFCTLLDNPNACPKFATNLQGAIKFGNRQTTFNTPNIFVLASDQWISGLVDDSFNICPGLLHLINAVFPACVPSGTASTPTCVCSFDTYIDCADIQAISFPSVSTTSALCP